ncbi:replicative DNA helicase [Roseimicrobium gellanilyticum]|uniref:Replicative DNA helicase n=1 Tax=Roseimicrobium gellanilyticum TaxID=748857 RepID=A0A366HNH3_9BACT|nr:replicative DNA helicase [Roseimicrobium gellanilyticum]RBP44336.1 replicative DNA helicase [Roseimicrobium gellanilyticum]
MPPEKASNVTPFDPNAAQSGGQGFQKGGQGFGQGKPKPPVDINDPTRSQPWDADAEKGVLSCFLHDPTNLLNDAQVNLPDEAFYHPANQLLYKVMKEFNNGTRPVEYIALTNYLRDAGHLDKIGGAGMLSELLNFVPTPAHYGYYKGILRDKHLLRRIIHACTESVQNAYEFNEDVPALLDRVEERVMSVRDDTESRDTIKPLKHHVMEAFDSIEEMLKDPGKLRGIPTGYRKLDGLSNGLQGGEMFVLAARPSMGKTSLVMNMVEHAALTNEVPVAVFSLEMSAVMLVRRLIVARAGVSMSRIMNGMLSREELRAVTRACSDLQKANIFIDETPGLNILDFRAKCRRLKKQHNIGMIAIDYLQLMTAPTKKSDSRQNEIAAISAGIKAVAKELNVPVVVLAQLNRAVESRKGQRPMLSDLRESGSIEQDADMVGLLTRADYAGSKQEDDSKDRKDAEAEDEASKGKGLLIIAKNRNGPTDDVPLKFIAELMRFTEREFDENEKAGGD